MSISDAGLLMRPERKEISSGEYFRIIRSNFNKRGFNFDSCPFQEFIADLEFTDCAKYFNRLIRDIKFASSSNLNDVADSVIDNSRNFFSMLEENEFNRTLVISYILFTDHATDGFVKLNGIKKNLENRLGYVQKDLQVLQKKIKTLEKSTSVSRYNSLHNLFSDRLVDPINVMMTNAGKKGWLGSSISEYLGIQTKYKESKIKLDNLSNESTHRDQSFDTLLKNVFGLAEKAIRKYQSTQYNSPYKDMIISGARIDFLEKLTNIDPRKNLKYYIGAINKQANLLTNPREKIELLNSAKPIFDRNYHRMQNDELNLSSLLYLGDQLLNNLQINGSIDWYYVPINYRLLKDSNFQIKTMDEQEKRRINLSIDIHILNHAHIKLKSFINMLNSKQRLEYVQLMNKEVGFEFKKNNPNECMLKVYSDFLGIANMAIKNKLIHERYKSTYERNIFRS